MMKSNFLVATLLVAACAGAMAARELKQTNSLCAPCPNNFLAYYPFGNTSYCPLCYKYPTPQCGSKYAGALCCGGDTGNVCPTIACSTSSSYAVSGPLGCSIATSSLSSLAVSSTTFNMKYIFKNVFTDICQAMPTELSDDLWYNVTTYIQAAATTLSENIAAAVASTMQNYNGYACSCAKCTSSCTSNNNKAKTIISGQVAAVAQACASTWLDAVAESVDSGCIGSGADAYAVAHADAMASSIENVMNSVLQQAYSSGNCSAVCQTYVFQTAVARAIACGYVDVLTKIRDEKYTYLSADADYNNVNSTSTQVTTPSAFSCSASMAISGSCAGSGTWSFNGTDYVVTGSQNWDVSCPVFCPPPVAGSTCPSYIASSCGGSSP